MSAPVDGPALPQVRGLDDGSGKVLVPMTCLELIEVLGALGVDDDTFEFAPDALRAVADKLMTALRIAECL